MGKKRKSSLPNKKNYKASRLRNLTRKDQQDLIVDVPQPVEIELQVSTSTFQENNLQRPKLVQEIQQANPESQTIENDLNLPELVVVPYETPGWKDPNICKLEGRRIVHLQHFIRQVRSLERHDCNSFPQGHMLFVKEWSLGFFSKLFFQCPQCKEKACVTTDPVNVPVGRVADTNKTDNKFNINDEAVWGASAVGNGFAKLDESFSMVGVPVMSEKTFNKIEGKLGGIWQSILIEQMTVAGKEEYRLASEAGDFCEDGITPFITVIADGGWSQRSHGHRYTAKSGVGCIIGYRTKKLLFVGVRNKYCATCQFRERRGLQESQHICFKNWSGTSQGMEADIIVEGFNRSFEMHRVEYRKLIADGDSSVLCKIRNNVSYGFQVSKIECANHSVKCFTTLLYKISGENAENRKFLSGPRIKRLTKGARGAIIHNAKHGSAQALRKDIENGPFHVFGVHSNCREYFCDRKNDKDLVSGMPVQLKAKIVGAANRLAEKSPRLITNDTSNQAENFMSLIAKHVGGKQVSRGRRGSYSFRAQAAGLSFQLGRNWHYVAYKKHSLVSPNVTIKRHIQKVQRSKQFERKSLKTLRERSKSFLSAPEATTSSVDGAADYGPHCNQPDMNEEEYRVESKKFLDGMQVTPEQQQEIEIATRGQSDNDRWRFERKNRLTASYYGEVCRRRGTTLSKGLVSRILYPQNVDHVPAIEYGSLNEKVALEEYERQTGVKVRECGLFVDLSFGYLAASPDGLLNEDGCVEIKCPSTGKDVTPLEIPGVNKNFYCKVDSTRQKLVLIRTNHYYYQIQGQLNITGRDFCDFIVWTPKGLSIETIKKDADFWKNEMLPKLTTFFLECMLPEIVDPRKKRSMELREPLHIEEANRNKTVCVRSKKRATSTKDLEEDKEDFS